MAYTHLPDPQLQEDFYANTPMKRLFAWVVDTVLIVLICIALLPFTAFTGIFFFAFLCLVVGFIYRVATLAGGSATLGMRLVAIEFRAADGTKLSGGQAFLHTLGYSLSMSMPLVQMASVLLMVTTARKQGLTDMVLGTVCINRPARH